MEPGATTEFLPKQGRHRSPLRHNLSANDVLEKSFVLDRDVGNADEINTVDEGLPNDVSRTIQLSSLPIVCLNQNPMTMKERPLRHVDEYGNVSTYALAPMNYSVVFILLIELLERFSFYGVNYTMTSFLTGAYDDLQNRFAYEERWNAEMSAIEASSMVSVSTAIAYSMPFVGAVLADSFLGDYKAMLVGSICFYLPGLLLILGSAIPHFWGLETFSRQALCTGLLVLWPVGTGIVKSIVNVFGAKQFHPLLQSALIESYYVNFYMCINIGALIGGIAVPVLAQSNIILAYMCPVAMLLIGIVLFLSGTPRYVRHPPMGDIFNGIKVFGTFGHKRRKDRKYKNNLLGSKPNATSPFNTILKISALIIPFNIAYSQMATTFIIQGTVMERAFGWIDAASMNNADAIAVLGFGHYIGSHLYPYLNQKGIKLSITNKFALGSTLGAFAIAWALYIEYKIYAQYEFNGSKVSILWQTVAYVSIGAGEIFAVSAAYEAAFMVSPPEQKVLSSALNLFCVGGIPNLLCLVLYNLCSGWFLPATETSGKSISSLEDYTSAEVYKYFLVLFIIACMGIFINILPVVENCVNLLEEEAAFIIKTPIIHKSSMTSRKLRRKADRSSGDLSVPVLWKQASDGYLSSSSNIEEDSASLETSPLIQVERHKAYLKYGSGPNLYKSGSMRAGPSLSKTKNSGVGKGDGTKDNLQEKKTLDRNLVDRLYQNTQNRSVIKKHGTNLSTSNLVVSPEGKPIRVGNFRETR